MKKFLAVFLSFAIAFTGCSVENTADNSISNSTSSETAETSESQIDTVETETEIIVTTAAQQDAFAYSELNDQDLIRYIEDSVYTDLVLRLDSTDYFIENVEGIYISKEYLDELAYNSQENIFFGYTLSELDAQFQGTRYVFTLDDDGQTTVIEFEEYDDTYDKVIRNVAIGAGVILLCVTVSVVTGGVGAPAAVSAVFAFSAKTATIAALSGGVISGVAAGVVKGIETNDFDEALKAAALSGSEGFMWGAITGAIAGGASEAIALKGATLNGLTMSEAAIIQKETGFPLDVIRQFSSMEQYEICKEAGLTAGMVNNQIALIRDIDLNFVDELGRTNLERMQIGLPPLDPTGTSYELHHIGQQVDSTLAILTQSEHRLGESFSIWHILGIGSEVHAPGNNWGTQVKNFWKSFAAMFA